MEDFSAIKAKLLEKKKQKEKEAKEKEIEIELELQIEKEQRRSNVDLDDLTPEMAKEIERVQKEVQNAPLTSPSRLASFNRKVQLNEMLQRLDTMKKDCAMKAEEYARELEIAQTTKLDHMKLHQELIKERDRLREEVNTLGKLHGEHEEAQRNLNRVQFGIEICFLIDCTNSMAPFIKAVRDKISEITEYLKEKDEKAILLVGFVGYRDICDHPYCYEFLEFTEDIEIFKDKLTNCRAFGGNDEPEDVVGGLKICTELTWTTSTRVLVHFADAPCHGKLWHSDKMHDDYPDGDPNGNSPEIFLDKLATYRVDYYFMRISHDTDMMTSAFKNMYHLY